MAGVQDGINVQFDDSAIQRALRELEQRAESVLPAMLEISEYLHERTRDHFDNAESPDGTPWATLTPETLARKSKKGVPVNLPLHGESLHLRDTIFPFASDVEAGVSTGPGTAAYAATHQFGDETRNIVARSFLGLSEEDEQEILRIIGEHLQRQS
ncbi:MAG: phage virion morphogenesis protein [Pseudomonadales bacterium]